MSAGYLFALRNHYLIGTLYERLASYNVGMNKFRQRVQSVGEKAALGESGKYLDRFEKGLRLEADKEMQI